jgi:hypothetical protein
MIESLYEIAGCFSGEEVKSYTNWANYDESTKGMSYCCYLVFDFICLMLGLLGGFCVLF